MVVQADEPRKIISVSTLQTLLRYIGSGSGFRISFRRVFNCDDNAVDTALYSNSVCGIQRNNIRISDDGTIAVGFKA